MADNFYASYPVTSGGGGSGTVTSVGLSLPAIFNVTGSPVTTSGTLTATLANESANLIFAGPASGPPAAPTFRSLVAADIPVPTSTPNTFAGFDGAGSLESVPGFTIDTTSGGMDIGLTQQPNNGGGGTVNSETYNFDPLQNSPNENWNIYNMNVQFDVNNSGFSQGTAGNAAQLLNLGFTHNNTGAIGQVTYLNNTANFGNGTDPLTTQGLQVSTTGINYNANVTLKNNLQGYSFNPNVNAAAIADPSFNVTAFADFSQIGIDVNGYQSFVSNPNLLNITNNHSFNGISIGANITTLTGSANAFGFNFFGNYGAFGATGGLVAFASNPTITTMGATGYYHGLDLFANITTSHGNIQGINVQPNITGGDANFTGININPSGGYTSPTVQGINVALGNIASTDKKIALTTTDSGIEINANYDTSLYPASPGFLQVNAVGGLYTVASGHPVSNTLTIANNFGVSSIFEDNYGPDAFGGFLGYVNVGFLSQLGVAAGKTVDTFTSLLVAGSAPSLPANGGTITNANSITVPGIVNGGGTLNITNLKGINIPSFFNGYSATNAWGVYVADVSVDNWFAKDVVIGGLTGKPVGSEVLSVTGTSLLSGALDMDTHQIHNVVDPTLAQDAATKNYVDATPDVNRRYVDFLNGNDANSGTAISPWKTLQHAYNSISPTINEPYTIYLSGGNNDTDSAITAKPNVSLVSDYIIQITPSFTISGGATNDVCTFTNIIFVGAFSWIRNDSTDIGLAFNNCQFFAGPTFRQEGAGVASVQALNSVFVNSEFQTAGGGFAIFTGCSFLGTTAFDDPGSSGFSYIQLDGGYSSGAMTIAGFYNSVYITGFVHDVAFGASVTFTNPGSGFATVEMDANGLPPTYTGAPASITYLSQAKYLNGVLPVANGGTNSSTALNNNRIMVSSGGAVVEAAALTNGQLLIGSTGAAPVAASLTAGSGITITPGAGSLTIAASGGGGGSIYDLTVGPTQTYTTIGSAIAAASAGQSIFIQTGTYVENPVVNKQLNITGSGRGVVISGSLTFDTSSDESLMTQFKVTGGFTINSGVSGIMATNWWNGSASTYTDNGTGTYVQLIQE